MSPPTRWNQTRPGWTFRRRVAVGLSLTAILAAAIGGIAICGLTQAVRSRDLIISVEARILADARELAESQANTSSSVRGFLLTGNENDLAAIESSRERFAKVIARLRSNIASDEGRRQLDEIVAADSAHQQLSEHVIGLYRAGASATVVRDALAGHVARARDTLDSRIQAVITRHDGLLEAATEASSRTALRAATFVLIATLALLLGAGVLAFVITEERQRMGDLIDALLQLSRVERADLHRSHVNLSSSLLDVSTMMRSSLATRTSFAATISEPAASSESHWTSAPSSKRRSNSVSTGSC